MNAAVLGQRFIVVLEIRLLGKINQNLFEHVVGELLFFRQLFAVDLFELIQKYARFKSETLGILFRKLAQRHFYRAGVDAELRRVADEHMVGVAVHRGIPLEHL
ncbi:hypothetical protein SDC9_172616 [bioreactor metagenome]|uniref:Uncharacterized protein n=1 Tax=bioreactor metagenome TaxID=1076179 RepID=A0A645GHE3_9ZZZZ